MNPERVREALRGGRLGDPLLLREEVGSTSEEANRMAREGAPEGALVVAERQTRGRGRWGRTWHSPPAGNLYFSLVLRPALAVERWPPIALAAGLGVVEALDGMGFSAGLKWPNDVLLDSRKVCGVLCEATSPPEGSAAYLVLGVGVNVNLDPDELPAELRDRATSLRAQAGRDIDRTPLLGAILTRFQSWYDRLLRGELDPVLARWRSRCVMFGEEVTYHTRAGRRRGLAVDLNRDGALLVRSQDGQVQVVQTGEVELISQRESRDEGTTDTGSDR